MSSERVGRGGKRCAKTDTSLAALVERIHAANPTGRGLSRRQERAQYEEKSRLQSQLIEDHGESVEVRVHDDMPGIVSLSVPSVERSAGHAILEMLSARARALLEVGLDDAEHRRREEPRQQPSRQHESEISRARRLVQEYDFECAEPLLLALVLGAGVDAPSAFETLIRLYVDDLGRDEDALRLAEQNQTLATSFDCRYSLGVAATRLGLFDQALAHLRQTPTPKTADAMVDVLRRALDLRNWRVVCSTLELLRRDAAYESVASSDSSARLRGVEKHLRAVLQDTTEKDIAADPDLAALAALVLPLHPALDALRARAREHRRRENVDRALEKLAAAQASADWVEAEAALDALQPAKGLLSVDDLARVDLATQALKRQRVHEAAQELALAARRCPDAQTALAYLRLPADVRMEARQRDETGLFDIVERLSTAPHREREIARAAAAWHSVTTDHGDGRSWGRVTPYRELLAHVPAIARHLDSLLSAAPDNLSTPPGSSSIVRSSSGHLRVVEAQRHSVLDPSKIVLADGLLEANGAEWVAVVHRIAEDAHELRLHPVRRGRSVVPVVVQLRSNTHWEAVAAVAVRTELHIMTAEARHHVVSLENGVAVRDGEQHERPSHMPGPREGGLLTLAEATPFATERVVFGAARPARARISMHHLEIQRGDRKDVFAIPQIDPRMVIDAPGGQDLVPVLLEYEPNTDQTFVWQQTVSGFWRGFRLGQSGEPIAAHTLASRGVLIVSRGGLTSLRIHRLALEEDLLYPTSAVPVERGLGLVVDAARRRAWSVAIDPTTLSLLVVPIGLRRANRIAP